jgi:hypothetical protein
MPKKDLINYIRFIDLHVTNNIPFKETLTWRRLENNELRWQFEFNGTVSSPTAKENFQFVVIHFQNDSLLEILNFLGDREGEKDTFNFYKNQQSELVSLLIQD